MLRSERVVDGEILPLDVIRLRCSFDDDVATPRRRRPRVGKRGKAHPRAKEVETCLGAARPYELIASALVEEGNEGVARGVIGRITRLFELLEDLGLRLLQLVPLGLHLDPHGRLAMLRAPVRLGSQLLLSDSKFLEGAERHDVALALPPDLNLHNVRRWEPTLC